MSTLSQDICDTRGTEIECLNSLSTTLQTGLSKRAIAILLELIESGVHPESLVDGKLKVL